MIGLPMRFIKAIHDQLLLKLPRSLTFRALRVLCEIHRVRNVVAEIGDGLVMEGSLRDRGVFCPLMYNGHYLSPHDMLETIVRRAPTGSYIDIGANIGATTIPLAISSKWDFYAFEPDPLNFERLECNLIHNGVRNRVRAYNVALSDQPGTLKLRKCSNNFGDYRLELGTERGEADGWDAIDVKVETLDRILSTSRLERPIVVKIDVQGAEPFVFRGGKSVLSSADVVATEFWPAAIKRMGNDPCAFFRTIAEEFEYVIAHDVSASWCTKLEINNHVERLLMQFSDEQFDILLSRLPLGQELISGFAAKESHSLIISAPQS
jgi:FkbM family methyltransferase